MAGYLPLQVETNLPAARDESASQAPERRRDWWRVSVVAALLGLAFLWAASPWEDFDVWWHLRGGQSSSSTAPFPASTSSPTPNRGWSVDRSLLVFQSSSRCVSGGRVSALVLLKAVGGVAIVALALASDARAPDLASRACLAARRDVLSGRLCDGPKLFSLLLLAISRGLGRAAERPRWLWGCRCCNFCG